MPNANPLNVRACLVCGATFRNRQGSNPNGGKYCSRPCMFAVQVPARTKPLAERFWPRVAKGDGCWTWTGFRDRAGYGRLPMKRADGAYRPALAHRVSWELSVGPLPEGAQVLHRCDNPPCVRPDHLFLGDPALNAADCAAKDRTTFGPRATGVRLTGDDARAILTAYRAGGETYKRLAARFGVGPATVADIVCGRTWRRHSGYGSGEDRAAHRDVA